MGHMDARISLDTLFALVREDGVSPKLNQQKLLFSHFTHLGCCLSGEKLYLLLANKEIETNSRLN